MTPNRGSHGKLRRTKRILSHARRRGDVAARGAGAAGCNRGGTAVCKGLIAAVLFAFGIIALVQDGTNAMVMPPTGLLPTLPIPAIETAALRRDVTVTRHGVVR